MSELAVRTPELDRYARLGEWLALSESGSSDPRARGAAAALRLYYAQELGLPPLAAAELSVIKGRLFVSAQLIRALAARAGYRVTRREGSNGETCTADLVDKETGEVLGSATFTLEDAKTAGLVRDGGGWRTHPARMLWARSSKNVVVDFAPEVALGIMLDDEIPEVTGVWSDDSGGAPEVAASPENSSAPVPADGADRVPEEPPLAPAPGASPEPTYPGLGFPRHAEGWMLLEDEWDSICESLNHDSPGEAQRLVDRWAELDHDAEAAIKTVKASDDTRVLHLFADREARAHGRVTVLRAIQKRLEKLTMPLPEALQPVDAGVRLLALVTFVRDQPTSVPNHHAWTEQKILSRIHELGWGSYDRIEGVPDETLTKVWEEKVPAHIRLHIDGMPVDKVKQLADMA